MSNIGSYDNRLKDFDWSLPEAELDYSAGDTLNIGWYCSDRICDLGKGEKTALIYESHDHVRRSYTFNDLRIASNTIGAFLKSSGIRPEDRVCLFLDRVPELYFSFLAILKIGAIVQPLFSAFGEESLFVRLNDAKTRAIITQRKHLGKIRRIQEQLPFLEKIIIIDCIAAAELNTKEIAFNYEGVDSVANLEICQTHPESPSLLHYTSGTTGQPKGVKHVHGSLFSQYLTASWILDLNENDIYWCTADPGWVTGTSYGIIGPWSLGITLCVLDTGFSAKAWYEFIERNRISVWYTAPTAIRALMKAGDEIIKDYIFTSLRNIASVGEPLNPEAIIWSQKNFGLPFLDTYWQTETGSIMISNYPQMKVKPGSMGRPFPGIDGCVLDPKSFEPIRECGKVGLIAFKPGWPAMMRTYWNNDTAYREKIVNGWYITGDKATIDEEGYFWFVGRNDDVINTGGHLISPFEVESALLEHPSVGESAVVSKPDPINMEVVKAFVSLNPGYEQSKELELDIMNFIRKKLSSFGMPQEIEFVSNLPKTRSGKIMRRLLHAKEWGEETGDISSLDKED